ncbi:MAG: twin-arginine translocation signal domain-containing protein, partial [Gemmatimonadota bacterium]|nr:twin-arginine translocation signal domain-containing protein [Gemmatimonadota bacterium]
MFKESTDTLSRRELLKAAAAGAGALAFPSLLAGCPGPLKEEPVASTSSSDLTRLRTWAAALRSEGLAESPLPVGRASTRVGELAVGSPYKAFTLEA